MDTLLLDKALRTAAPVVQVQPELGVGDYTVDLTLTDAAGVQATAQLRFAIRDRTDRPPVDRPPVDGPPLERPRERPVVTPAPRPTEPPTTPAPRPTRPPVKRPRPPTRPIEG